MSNMIPDHNYQNLFPKEPESIHRAVLQALEQLDEKTAVNKSDAKSRKRHHFIRKWGIAAAMLLVFVGATVTAAGKFPWNRWLAEFWGSPSQEVQDELGENGLFALQESSATNGGITATVLQTVQDRRSVTILLQVTAEDRELEDILEEGEFDHIWLRQEDGSDLLSHPAVDTTGFRYEDKQVARTEQGLAAYMIFEFHWKATEDISFDHFLLSLNDYRYGFGSENIIDGYWELPITVDTAQTAELTKICEPDQEIVIEGDSFLITEIALTPLSIEISGQAPKSADADVFNACHSGTEYVLEDLEGNIMDVSTHCGNSGGGYQSTDPFQEFYTIVKFDQIVDVHNIKALLMRLGEEEYRIEFP